MVEWLKAPVLKTGEGLRPPRVRIPIPPPSELKNPLVERLRDFYFVLRYLVNPFTSEITA